uniref:Proton-gated ion channel n=1 Tax=Gloeobacter violaceus TaxID=33072 RepID=UPI0003BB553E|nr:Chain A, Proton-gated ion channel [Gloeobacter violaceus]4LML_B Chain B, Proton-gated ion channel [Gloeobacter violaceus]4LML_C Chain C, Proton-gated ion channel [Gloeobacter violaceus]4LML_D Chain D, Proton-gated ion channel [Gloeobacter violaceus]4LML_E Chain E, Proton-gated ion channel [Gloeobacter violaceus]
GSQDMVSPPPPIADEPLTVNTGIYLIECYSLDDKAETFKVNAFLSLSWKDRRLAFDPVRSGVRVKTYEPEAIWIPEIRFVNVENARDADVVDISVSPDGTVQYLERFSARVLSPLDFRRYPFDSQTLHIYLIVRSVDTRNIVLAVDLEKVGKNDDVFLTGWDIESFTAVVKPANFALEDRLESKLDYQLRISRQYFSYIPNIILPMLFILFISWTAFWSTSYEANVTLVVSTLAAHIAFNILVETNLPKAPYMTYTGAIIFMIYLFYFVAVIEVTVQHYLKVESQPARAASITRASRIAFPVVFLLANIILAFLFFGF